MRKITCLLAALLFAAGCGTGGDSTGSGPFSIKGAPHSGSYTTCSVSGETASRVLVKCTGMAGCSGSARGCEIDFNFPAAAGTYTCETGVVNLTLFDPSITDNTLNAANATCGSPGKTQDCPADTSGCNHAWGSCSLTVNSVTPSTHFDGSLTAKTFTHMTTVSCGTGNELQNAGTEYDLTGSGSW